MGPSTMVYSLGEGYILYSNYLYYFGYSYPLSQSENEKEIYTLLNVQYGTVVFEYKKLKFLSWRNTSCSAFRRLKKFFSVISYAIATLVISFFLDAISWSTIVSVPSVLWLFYFEVIANISVT